MSGGNRFSNEKSEIILSIAKLPSEFIHELFLFLNLRSSGLTVQTTNSKSGFFENETRKLNINGFLLFSTINEKNGLSEINLINIETKKIIQTWQPDYNMLNLRSFSKFHTRLLHPVLLPNGNLLINLNDRLTKIDKNSKIIWEVSATSHHSIEVDSNNYIWTCGTLIKSNLHKIKSLIRDDAVLKIDANNGKIVYQKSIFDILIENNYQNLFYYLGPMNDDPIHVNDIQPALINSKYWKKGDLLISLRHRSTVFLYRPSTNKVIWLKTGPWSYQHDCDFLNDHEIGIFGNDVVRVSNKDILINDYNNQYVYDFKTDKVQTPYTKMFKEGKIKTLTEGRSRVLPDGKLYVEESNYGRVLFGDSNGLLGGYVSQVGKNQAAMLGWSRYYTKEELEKATTQKF